MFNWTGSSKTTIEYFADQLSVEYAFVFSKFLAIPSIYSAVLHSTLRLKSLNLFDLCGLGAADFWHKLSGDYISLADSFMHRIALVSFQLAFCEMLFMNLQRKTNGGYGATAYDLLNYFSCFGHCLYQSAWYVENENRYKYQSCLLETVKLFTVHFTVSAVESRCRQKIYLSLECGWVC